MIDQDYSSNMLFALLRIDSRLPTLFDPDIWERVKGDFNATKSNLSSTDESVRLQAAVRIVQLVSEAPSARQALEQELNVCNALQSVLQNQPAFTDENDSRSTNEVDNGLSLVPLKFSDFEWSSDEQRTIPLESGGVGGAKSFKFSNMRLDFGELIEIGSGAALTGYEIATNPNMIVVVAGILSTIRAVTKAATVELSERESTVFWGLLKARDSKFCATEDAIISMTNTERQKYGLSLLSESEVRLALERLLMIKSVDLVDGNWKIIENYRIL